MYALSFSLPLAPPFTVPCQQSDCLAGLCMSSVSEYTCNYHDCTDIWTNRQDIYFHNQFVSLSVSLSLSPYRCSTIRRTARIVSKLLPYNCNQQTFYASSCTAFCISTDVVLTLCLWYTNELPVYQTNVV